MKSHCFPDTITAHKLTFNDGSRITLLVAPTETYGKAMARAGYRDEDVSCIELEDSPLNYEPDNSIASR